MAIVPCRECGREISDQAEACPHCGAPTKKPAAKTGQLDSSASGNVRSCMGCLGLLVAAAVIVWMASLCSGPTEPREAVDRPSLDATVRLTSTQVVVVNDSEEDWRDCAVEINPGTLTSGYSQDGFMILAGDSVAGGLLAFTKSGGERFNPQTHAVEQVMVRCETPAGRAYFFGSP